LEALLAKARVPLVEPVAFGRNVTVNAADWPADSVIGRAIPLTVNSVLERLAPEIVTDDPLALSAPFKVALDPVITLPKFSAVGVSCNCPAAAPDPDNPMFRTGFEAFDAMANVPELVPVAVGVKTTANVTLCPAVRFMGKLSPVTVNDPLDTVAPDRVTVVLPVLVTVSINVPEFPGMMLPKARLAGDPVIAPAPPVLETPEPSKDAEVDVVVEPPFLQR
jgi:hypothetical protein